MENLKEKAAFYRIGLILGVHTIDDVIDWCDSEILNSEKPNNDLIDISLNNKRKEIISILSKISNGVDEIKVLYKILGELYFILKEDKNNAFSYSNRLYTLVNELEEKYLTHPNLNSISRIDDNFYLERDGIIEINKSYNEFLDFLKPYAEKDE